jgi:hypothetical protein
LHRRVGQGRLLFIRNWQYCEIISFHNINPHCGTK